MSEPPKTAAREPDPRAFAELLCGYCLGVQVGEQVLVRGSTLASDPMLEMQRAILGRRAWPLLRVELPGETAAFYGHAHDEQIDAHAPLALQEARSIDCRVIIQAPANTRELSGVDPDRLVRAARARAPVREELMAGTRWCGTLWPTDALAQQAGMSRTDYGSLVCRAMFLDRPDPAAAWRELHDFQEQLIARLAPTRELHLQAPGTDLRLRVDGRTWVNSDGRRNLPSGEIFTGPLEDSAEGTVSFTVPSSPSGVEVSGVRLVFRAGEVVQASAARGEEYLRSMIASDDGARRLGEIGIGTNRGIDRPTGTILFDEKIGGTVHLALGRSYPETGGLNVSALHWDLICDLRHGGTLTADADVLQRDGAFVG